MHVLNNFPLKQVLQKMDASARLLKWTMELSDFDLVFKIRATIKGQALTDFVVELTPTPEMKFVETSTWNLFVDGSSRDTEFREGVAFVSLEGHKLSYIVRFGFKATNNCYTLI